MFGISPIGWVHTLGSLPAIPAAIYMFARYGRIVPQSTAGAIYFFSMVIGSISLYVIAPGPIGYGFGTLTLLLLIAGYRVDRFPAFGRAAPYLERIFLTLTVLFLMVPSVNETLTRAPDGHPIASGPNDPIVLGAIALLLLLFVVGLTAQIIHLRRQGAQAGGIGGDRRADVTAPSTDIAR